MGITLHANNLQLSHIEQDKNKVNVSIDYSLSDDTILLHDSLSFSIDNPDFTVQEWQSTQLPTKHYDATALTNQSGYTGDGSFTVSLEASQPIPLKSNLYIHYLLQGNTQPEEKVIPLSFHNTLTHDSQQATCATTEKSLPNKAISQISTALSSLKKWMADLVQNTESMWLQLCFVLLLGILMSLTPCIYPMIPITLGILQTTSSKSFFTNFLLALSYTVGIASTFATLGLLAASGSTQFGSLLGNPYFVAFLVIFLGYLALSMLGFYDMYIPRFMQTSSQQSVNGSFLSAFVFGAISGSIASPCVSPGLLMLLSIVATLGNKLLGFLYLFTFGFGIGTPLLLLGTFSGALTVLPRAGMWMVEVKKIFGLMLLSMCLYYLTPILAWPIVLIIGGIVFGFCSALYLGTIQQYDSINMKLYKYGIGTILLAGSLLTLFNAYKASYQIDEETTIFSTTSYYDALQEGCAANKLLLLDFGALWCSSCKEIEREILHNTQVRTKLDPHVIFVPIDCTNPSESYCAKLQEQFNVLGFPAIILVNPADETIVARWGSELTSITPKEFIQRVSTYL